MSSTSRGITVPEEEAERKTAEGPWGGKSEVTGTYADVNGIKLYYEIHGTGRPLVLLHGGLASGATFGPNLSALAEGHQVIVPDLQGHGRTAAIDRPLTPELMAGYIAARIKHLRVGQVDLVGHSLAAGVAF